MNVYKRLATSLLLASTVALAGVACSSQPADENAAAPAVGPGRVTPKILPANDCDHIDHSCVPSAFICTQYCTDICVYADGGTEVLISGLDVDGECLANYCLAHPGTSGCPAPPTCGDGSCIYPEDHSSCPQDCDPVCGDGSCQGSESCSNCPNDCGQCPAVCGNYRCEAGETCNGCATDCGPCCRTSCNPGECGPQPDWCGGTLNCGSCGGGGGGGPECSNDTDCEARCFETGMCVNGGSSEAYCLCGT